uniref:G-protein-signaling modulator 2-like n=1 Tax=Xiphophorus maculatus TaxID=8083 RepID=A0A3B5QWG4_XIPMA
MESSCLDLALEGERLCKAGNYRAGVSFFESAIQIGTEDLQILSAIYSQLGNAYFHLQEYNKALEYHRHDLTLTRTIGDELGEAKASGNLGNTLKVLRRYNEAVVCCQRHLDITRAVFDKVGQARALYNFGNIYHAKGKSICWSGTEPGEFPEEARIAFRKAAQFYEANLSLVNELGDRAAQGRTYGNLGNTYYLLGDFERAVTAHEKRLLIAKEFGDKSAERRAHCNLGNAYIFLGQFEMAANHYKKTLQLARLFKDKAVEAQACYSLGNTYTLLQDYERAIDFHLKHLVIAQDLNDRYGISTCLLGCKTGDKSSEMTARMNLSDLRIVVNLKANAGLNHMFSNSNTNSSGVADNIQGYINLPGKHLFTGSSKNNTIMASTKHFFFHRLRSKKYKDSKSKEHLENFSEHPASEEDSPLSKSTPHDTIGEDTFFDLLSRFQGNRMDDQRCTLDGLNRSSAQPSPTSSLPVAEEKCECHETPSQDPGHFLELLASSQAHRLDDQRVSLNQLPGLRLSICNPPHIPSASSKDQAPSQEGDEVFFDMLVKCQGSRLNDQRCPAPTSKAKGPTVPNEDFFSLILRSQSNRMEEQRVAAPPRVSQSKPG